MTKPPFAVVWTQIAGSNPADLGLAGVGARRAGWVAWAATFRSFAAKTIFDMARSPLKPVGFPVANRCSAEAKVGVRDRLFILGNAEPFDSSWRARRDDLDCPSAWLIHGVAPYGNARHREHLSSPRKKPRAVSRLFRAVANGLERISIADPTCDGSLIQRNPACRCRTGKAPLFGKWRQDNVVTDWVKRQPEWAGLSSPYGKTAIEQDKSVY